MSGSRDRAVRNVPAWLWAATAPLPLPDARKTESGGFPRQREPTRNEGFLAGKIDDKTTFEKNDFRNIVPRFTQAARKANQALVELLGQIASERAQHRRRSRSHLFSRRSTWIVPIAGTTKLHRLQENLGAANVEPTPALERISHHGTRPHPRAGHLARNTTRRFLRDADAKVALYPRRARRLENPDPTRVRIVEGDVLDARPLPDAMRGQDVNS